MDTQDERADRLAALVEAALQEPEPKGPELPPDDADFIVTKEHRRFAEFAAAVRRDRYIGLCYGPPGVGKTASARRYACWHELEPLLRAPGRHFTEGRDRADWHTLLYTPIVSATPRTIDKELTRLGWDLTTIRTPDPFDRRTYASTHALPPFVEAIVFRTIGDPPSSWESQLPAELLRLPEELARVDAVLDDPAFFAPFAPHFHPVLGRPSTPVECYLRLMFLKFRYRLGALRAAERVTSRVPEAGQTRASQVPRRRDMLLAGLTS